MRTGRIHDADTSLSRALGLDAEAKAKGTSAAKGAAEAGAPAKAKAKSVDGEAAYARATSRAAKQDAAARAAAGVHTDAKTVGASSPLFVRGAEVHHPGHPHHKERLKPAWKELAAALVAPSGTEELALPALEGRLRALGFAKAKGKGSKGQWVRGAQVVKVEPFSIGHFGAIRVSLSRAGDTAPRFGGVAVAGVVIPQRHWSVLESRYREEVAGFIDSVRATRGQELPATMTGLKAFMRAGLDADTLGRAKARDAELQRHLGGLTKALVDLRKRGQAPKGVVICVDGPDGAGKSSTGEIVMRALKGAGYVLRHDTFKAPTAEEREHFWLDRFRRGLPQAGEAFFWDRGPAGDVVYGGVSKKREKAMAKELATFERELRDDGVLFVKVELHAAKKKQASTFGKRLARQHIADTIEASLEKRGQLAPEVKAGLDDITNKIGLGDLRALTRFDEVQARYEDFIARSGDVSPWIELDATKRHDARLALIAGLRGQLEHFAKHAEAR